MFNLVLLVLLIPSEGSGWKETKPRVDLGEPVAFGDITTLDDREQVYIVGPLGGMRDLLTINPANKQWRFVASNIHKYELDGESRPIFNRNGKRVVITGNMQSADPTPPRERNRYRPPTAAAATASNDPVDEEIFTNGFGRNFGDSGGNDDFANSRTYRRDASAQRRWVERDPLPGYVIVPGSRDQQYTNAWGDLAGYALKRETMELVALTISPDDKWRLISENARNYDFVKGQPVLFKFENCEPFYHLPDLVKMRGGLGIVEEPLPAGTKLRFPHFSEAAFEDKVVVFSGPPPPAPPPISLSTDNSADDEDGLIGDIWRSAVWTVGAGLDAAAYLYKERPVLSWLRNRLAPKQEWHPPMMPPVDPSVQSSSVPIVAAPIVDSSSVPSVGNRGSSRVAPTVQSSSVSIVDTGAPGNYWEDWLEYKTEEDVDGMIGDIWRSTGWTVGKGREAYRYVHSRLGAKQDSPPITSNGLANTGSRSVPSIGASSVHSSSVRSVNRMRLSNPSIVHSNSVPSVNHAGLRIPTFVSPHDRPHDHGLGFSALADIDVDSSTMVVPKIGGKKVSFNMGDAKGAETSLRFVLGGRSNKSDDRFALGGRKNKVDDRFALGGRKIGSSTSDNTRFVAGGSASWLGRYASDQVGDFSGLMDDDASMLVPSLDQQLGDFVLREDVEKAVEEKTAMSVMEMGASLYPLFWRALVESGLITREVSGTEMDQVVFRLGELALAGLPLMSNHYSVEELEQMSPQERALLILEFGEVIDEDGNLSLEHFADILGDPDQDQQEFTGNLGGEDFDQHEEEYHIDSDVEDFGSF